MSANDGGPAFPQAVELDKERQIYVTTEGMSLRDYFAAHAPDPPPYWKHDVYHEDQFYKWRWHYADAMLAEREKKI